MSNNFPNVSPSLNLNFAASKVLDPRITFSRASAGTYYDGKTFVKAEENLLLYSQQFDNAYWSKLQVTVTADAAVAPDGTSTADAMMETADNNLHRLIVNGNFTLDNSSAFIYSSSVYVKANGRTKGSFGFYGGGVFPLVAVNFDLTAGTITSAASGTGVLTASSITPAGSDWYRIAVSGSLGGAATIANVRIGTQNDAGDNTFLGDITKGLYVWGAQFEIRSASTAYTPTTTQPITNYIPKMLFAPANVPVFDHNPTTGEALGLSVWEARTNLLQRSQEFDDAYWTKTNSTVTANQIIAPDGTLTADKLVSNAAAVNANVNRSVTKSAVATTYAYSVFAKKAEWDRVWVLVSDSASFANRASVIVSLIDGTVTTAAAAVGTFTAASATIENVGNGVYRVKLVFTSSTETGLVARIYPVDSAGTFTGDGYSGIYIWGAQLESGQFSTPYIPTVGSTVARSADVAVMTGVNFSRWFNAGQGALVVEGRRDGTSSAFPNLATASDGTANNRILISIYGATNQPAFDVVSGGATQCALTKTAVGAGVFAKVAASYQTNSFAMTANGASVETDTLGTIPVVNQLRIGSNATGTVDLNGYIRSLSYYPIALTSAQLQAVTA